MVSVFMMSQKAPSDTHALKYMHMMLIVHRTYNPEDGRGATKPVTQVRRMKADLIVDGQM
jgi:hypothetical protein